MEFILPHWTAKCWGLEEMFSLSQSKSWSFGIQKDWVYPCKFPKYALIFPSGYFAPAEFGLFYHLPSPSGPLILTLELLHSNANQVLSLGDRNKYDASMKHGITDLLCLFLQAALSLGLTPRVALLISAETMDTKWQVTAQALGIQGWLLPQAHSVLWEMPRRKVAARGHQAVYVALVAPWM